jgi:hypothetical protein
MRIIHWRLSGERITNFVPVSIGGDEVNGFRYMQKIVLRMVIQMGEVVRGL